MSTLKLKHQLVDGLNYLKKSNNWTQVEMAKSLGVSQPRISICLDKERAAKTISLEYLIEIYIAFGGKVDLILRN